MPDSLKILFIINEGAGNSSTDWQKEISEYFKESVHDIEFLKLGKNIDKKEIRKKILDSGAQRVVSVGGDGTFALIATILMGQSIPVGLLKGGSANGMGRELEIPDDISKALDIITGDYIINMDTIQINEEKYVYHLADIGLNALIIKYFDESRFRGMWNYARMLFKALVNHSLMKVTIKSDEGEKTVSAYMVVFANASKYGTGAIINPDSSLTDGTFELVVVRRIAFIELLKLFWNHKGFNPKNVEIITTKSAEITSHKGVHFQIDGQYLGKTRKIVADIVPGAVKVLAPGG